MTRVARFLGAHRRTGLALLFPLTLGMTACAGESDAPDCEGETCDLNPIGDGPQYDRYRGFKQHVKGIPGILPENSELFGHYKQLSEVQREGLATWHLFAADGQFIREATLASHGAANVLKVIDNKEQSRNLRFDQFGTLNDPGCKVGTKPDQFGLTLDDCADPYSSGIVGLRLKPNPKFDKEFEKIDEDTGERSKTGVNNFDLWKAIGGAKGHFAEPDKEFDVTVDGKRLEVKGWEVEPPYLPSLACTVCHAAPHPQNPPKDINNPRWDEIAFGLGNQYFREGAFLGNSAPEGDFARQVLLSQPPGTSDTSRVATDHLFNPNVINAVANLGARPLFKEKALPGRFTHDRIQCSMCRRPAASSWTCWRGARTRAPAARIPPTASACRRCMCSRTAPTRADPAARCSASTSTSARAPST
jgi:hypothetical protein